MSTLILFFHSMKLMCTKFGDQHLNTEDVSSVRLNPSQNWGSDLLKVFSELWKATHNFPNKFNEDFPDSLDIQYPQISTFIVLKVVFLSVGG